MNYPNATCDGCFVAAFPPPNDNVLCPETRLIINRDKYDSYMFTIRVFIALLLAKIIQFFIYKSHNNVDKIFHVMSLKR